jgi:hypothetical protein
MLRSLTLGALAILGLSQACLAGDVADAVRQGDGRVSPFYAWSGAVAAEPGTPLRKEPLEPSLSLPTAGAAYRILYASTNGVGAPSPVAVSGLVFLPKGIPPAGGWPLLAWAHETAGIADVCAPSWSGYSLRVEGFLQPWLSRGYAIVATDYQGLGTPGPHPYSVPKPAGLDVLDSIRAAQRAFPRIGKKVLLAGYSQGAGAVYEADALQPSYAPELDIRGTIAMGMPYLMPQTIVGMRSATANQAGLTLIYPLYVGRLMQQMNPALRDTDLFTDKALPLFRQTLRGCVWRLALEVLVSRLTRNESVKPGYQKALEDIAPMFAYSSLRAPHPLFLAIGELDQDTPTRLQLEFAKDACAAGTTVEAHLYAGMTHDTNVARALDDGLRFADRAMKKAPITSACTPEAE